MRKAVNVEAVNYVLYVFVCMLGLITDSNLAGGWGIHPPAGGPVPGIDLGYAAAGMVWLLRTSAVNVAEAS